MDISVKTGVETFRIKDEHDNVIGQFEFNPADTNIYMRYQKVADAFKEFDFEKALEGENGITNADNFIREQFDYLFGYEVSDGIFGRTGPFTPYIDGSVFCMNVINAIGDIIKKSTEKRIKKIDAQVKKATERYNQ